MGSATVLHFMDVLLNFLRGSLSSWLFCFIWSVLWVSDECYQVLIFRKIFEFKRSLPEFLLPVLWSETWNAFFKKFSSVSLAFCIIDWCVILCFSCLHLFVYLSVLFLVHDVFKGGHILSIECIPNSDLSPTQVFIKLCSVKYTDPAYLLGWLRKFYQGSLVHHIV